LFNISLKYQNLAFNHWHLAGSILARKDSSVI